LPAMAQLRWSPLIGGIRLILLRPF